MPRHYNHLDYARRSQISVLKSTGYSNKEIGTTLKVSTSTVGRELKRNCSANGDYCHDIAEKKAKDRQKKAHSVLRKMIPEFIERINVLIKEDWSPEQISGWLYRNHNIKISPERIYQHIWVDKKTGGNLYRHLRHQGKKYNYTRNTKAAGRGHIPNRKDISERPSIVEEKSRVGDLEIDLIIGENHKGAVLSVVDRATKMIFLEKLSNKSASIVTRSILSILSTLNFPVFTITVDNGKEFAWHEFITKVTGTTIFLRNLTSHGCEVLMSITMDWYGNIYPKRLDVFFMQRMTISRLLLKSLIIGQEKC